MTADPTHRADTITVTIDDVPVTVPKGTLVIRAAEQAGIQIPRFCDHPLLPPAGACRQCLVDIAMPGPDGSLRPMPKPQASCTQEATDGMVVHTQHTSDVAAKAQEGVLEFLLINHPLDCPVCDKGGECPLQNQAMSEGRPTSRFVDIKRTYAKPISLTEQILLDRERCVLCQRCTRFSREIAGDPFIDLQMRGARQQIGRFDVNVLGVTGDQPMGEGLPDQSGRPFASYFSGNIVQICPVGALTSAEYRFRSRPFDLVSTPGVTEHDSSGAALRVDHRRGKVMRRLAGDDPDVNQEWLSDKDRFAFEWQDDELRLSVPLVRDRAHGGAGELRPASWVEAFEVAEDGLRRAIDAGAGHGRGVGVLTGGRLPLEDSYAYAKFARLVLGSNDIDFRARPSSAEETDFLGSMVAGSSLAVTYADIDQAPVVLLVDFEPEEEGGTTFLRLREAVRQHGTKVYAIAPFATRGLDRLGGVLLPAAPGTQARILTAVADRAEGIDDVIPELAELLAAPGAIIVVGERAASVPGTYSAAVGLAETTGAKLAWIPRRCGERGAVEAGAVPNLLPGGRPVADPAARVDAALVWGVEPADLPTGQGRDSEQILAAARAGELAGLIVAGLEPDDFVDPHAVEDALSAVDFLVSFEVCHSAVTERADVVFPVAPPTERPGTYINWEGRRRPFPQALTSRSMADHKVLDALAEEFGVHLGTAALANVHDELARFEGWDGARVPKPAVAGRPIAEPPHGLAVLATWRHLIDDGLCQRGDPYYAGTAKRAAARMSSATAIAAGYNPNEDRPWLVEVSAPDGGPSIVVPLQITDMPDHVVWLPTNSPGSHVHRQLHADSGDLVHLAVRPTEKETQS